MATIYERLRALQINLPELPPPVVDGYVPSFVPFVRAGNLIYLSGRLAKKDGKPFSGKLGQQITTAEGRQAARDVAIEILATLQAALGDLNKVKRIVKMTVLVNSAPGFTESHKVADGASELLREVFGEGGAHARTSHGGAEIPFGSCVEIEMIVEVSHSRQRAPGMKSTTNRPASRAGNRAIAGKRANSRSIAAVEGPLSRLIGEKGTELKTPRSAIPM